MTDIESIRKRHEAATPGPCAYMGDDQAFMREIRTCGDFSLICTMDRGGPDPDADGAFLAAAHDDVGVLLAEVERLTAALVNAKDEERAAVVALMRREADMYDRRLSGSSLAAALRMCAVVIESNRHRGKA